MPVEFRKYITRQMLKDERDKLFVFGDNMRRIGLGGQAAEMRGEPNAVGLPTKWRPLWSPDSFFVDADLGPVIGESSKDVGRLLKHAITGGTIVWPTDGIGTGKARLKECAPHIANYYDRVLTALIEGNPTRLRG